MSPPPPVTGATAESIWQNVPLIFLFRITSILEKQDTSTRPSPSHEIKWPDALLVCRSTLNIIKKYLTYSFGCQLVMQNHFAAEKENDFMKLFAKCFGLATANRWVRSQIEQFSKRKSGYIIH